MAGDVFVFFSKNKIGADGWTSDDNLKWRREYAPPILNALET